MDQETDRSCSVPNCENEWRFGGTAGVCGGHVYRMKKHGDYFPDIPLGAGTRRAILEATGRLDVAARFWANVDQSGDHWLWTGSLLVNRDFPNEAGYGRLRIGGRGAKQILAHRWSYEAAHGPIPDGLVIDHTCRVRNCVRPDHLRAVTPAVNALENTKNPSANLATTCRHGHPRAEFETVGKTGARWCRECLRLRAAARR
jgi:hypothetical protein